MYSKEKIILNKSTTELSTFIQNGDIFNSKFIKIFRMLPPLGLYNLNASEQRLDLISKKLYNTDSYGELILLYNGMTIKDLKPNIEIKVFDEEKFINLTSDISTIVSPRDYIKSIS